MHAKEEIAQQLKLLLTYRRNLQHSLEQMALQGGPSHVLPSVMNSIHDCRENIRRIKNVLRSYGFTVNSHPNDEPPHEQPLVMLARGEPSQRVRQRGATPLHNRVLAGRSDPFSAGMIILRDLMIESIDIGRAARGFCDKFQIACEHLELLNAYKSLHDELHELQFRWYNTVVIEILDFPYTAITYNNLRRYAPNLESVIKHVQAIIDQKVLPSSKTTWFLDLIQAQNAFHIAIEQHDHGQLKRATELVRQVLASEPPLINDDLTDAATAMHLPDLVDEMNDIYAIMVHLHIDHERLLIFKQAIMVVEHMSSELQQMVDDHGRWQYIDRVLRRIEGCLMWTNDELMSSWPDLTTRAESLYSSSSDWWAIVLRDDSAHLVTAMSTQDHVEMKQYFRSYRAMAGQRFFEVDLLLKGVCERVRQIERPLTWVLGALEYDR